MSSFNSGALKPEDVAALRIVAGESFDKPVTLPSGRVISGKEATALCAALVEESIIQEPEPGDDRLRCGECNQVLRVGDAQLLFHQDGTPICKTPEREAWLSARHLLAVEPYEERSRPPLRIFSRLLFLGVVAAGTYGILWTIVQVFK